MSNNKPQLIVLGSVDTIKGNPGMFKEGYSRKERFHSEDPAEKERSPRAKKAGATAKKTAAKKGAKKTAAKKGARKTSARKAPRS